MSIEKNLSTLDEQIKAAGGPGLFELLATLAEQTFGIQRSAFTPPKPEPKTDEKEPPPDPGKTTPHGHAQRK